MKKLKIKLEKIFNFLFAETGTTLFNVMANDTTAYANVVDFINTNNVDELNMDYFIGFSSEKYLSPLVMKYVIYELDVLGYDLEDLILDNVSATDLSTLATYLTNKLTPLLYQRFGVKWKKIYDALMTSYAPLENYRMEETRTPDLTDVRTPNITRTNDGNNGVTSSANNGVYGFNSTGSQPNTTASGSQTETIDEESTETGTETTTHTGTETLERSGNIGVTTSQQMLESELNLRQYDFFKTIYKDIDSILCLGIY